MEPRIQYVKTKDAVSIAYWTLGEGGVPLLLTSPHTASATRQREGAGARPRARRHRTRGAASARRDGDQAHRRRHHGSFPSASGALACAVALQRAFAQHSVGADEPIVVRIGLNVGEPIEEDGDFFGSAVILGARIKDQAGGGEILVPEAVRHLLSGKDFLFADRGEIVLRGFEDPVRLYEVRWRE